MMKKMNVLLYKVLGSGLILLSLSLVHFSYFDAPKYGNGPFFICCMMFIGCYLILPYLLDKIVISFGIVAYTLYTVIQVCYCKLFDQYLFLESGFSLLDEAGAYKSDALNLISLKELVILGIILLIVIFFLFLRKNQSKNIQYTLICLVSGTLLFGTSVLCGMKYNQMIVDLGRDVFMYNQTDRYLYDKIPSKKMFVEYFGLETFFFRDIKDHYLINSAVLEEQYQRVDEFLSGNLPYEENEMTGILSGKHLLLVEAESLTMAAVDEKLTPTLYRLLHEGWFFDGFYSPTMTGSTSDVETMVNTSLIAINTGKIASQAYADNTYPVTLAKGFQAEGYSVNAYHNNYKIYYNRDRYFDALGYTKFLDSTEMGLDNCSSDFMVAQKISWIPVEKELDFSFWVTYSGHQPYELDLLSDTTHFPVDVQKEYEGYLEIVKETYPDLHEMVQFYMAKNISLDKAIEYYINTYEWMGKLDQLVIAFYGDHYVKLYEKGVKDSAYEALGRSMEDTPFVIWYPGIEAKVIDKVCTDIDIIPTLFNLYGVEYDKSMILGNDIFDPRYNGFTFDTAWNISSNSYDYDAETKTFTRLEIDEKEAYESLYRYMDYQEISNLIFENDYFSHR